MGDFNSVAGLLRDIAKRPSPAQQREARQAGLKPLVASAKAHLAANGSNKTGKLSASLGVAEKGPNTSAAGPIKGKKHARVGHLVELGTAPHYQPRRGVMHPGAAPHPFMRPAFEETKQQIVDEAGKSLAQAIFGKIGT